LIPVVKKKTKMAYDKFNILTSTAVPLSIENVDTDQIIPRFLKATERVGFGDNLSTGYNNDDSPKSDFVLNATYGGKILVGGRNFGSGSSRNNRLFMITVSDVWSSFFADILETTV
jgi:3-isopropylmalate/(R)-2-methylmalate dehydratase small subunit